MRKLEIIRASLLLCAACILFSLLVGCASDSRPCVWVHGGPDGKEPSLEQYILENCEIAGKRIDHAAPLKSWTEGSVLHLQYGVETEDGEHHLLTVYGETASSYGLDVMIYIDGYTCETKG